jgi:hypothetical protein
MMKRTESSSVSDYPRTGQNFVLQFTEDQAATYSPESVIQGM